jgi:polysaccharide deacetylase family protein (PEP-CTERM system associated)
MLPKVRKNAVVNAMTIDVEDYFHVAAFSKHINPNNWHEFTPRVEDNTHRLLDLFDEQQVHATFFVLGWVAERFPALVRTIATRGHEVACHGYSHQMIYRQAPSEFREETVRAKRYIEDQVQCPVLGYRAATYSITRDSLWAIDVLVELGFLYDSSIFPIHHDLYGIVESPRWPYRLAAANGGSIVEFPLSTVSILGYRLPIAGGGYFRLYPYQVTRSALAHINLREGRPFIFYLHPWEIDPAQPRIKAGLLSQFRHYTNLHRCEERLRQLLKDFQFAPARDVFMELPTLDDQDFVQPCNGVNRFTKRSV